MARRLLSTTGREPVKIIQRSTSDLVILGLTALVAAVLLISLVGGILWKANDPTADLTDMASRIGDLTNTLIGAIVGFLAGKGTGAAGAYQDTLVPPLAPQVPPQNDAPL